MAKRGSRNAEKELEREYLDLESGSRPRSAAGSRASRAFSGVTGAVFVAGKFAAGLCLLPFVFSCTGAFLSEFQRFPPTIQRYFWAGVVTFIISYLFIWDAQTVYAAGQKIMEVVFSFYRPAGRIAPVVVPVYTVLFFIAYAIINAAAKEPWLGNYCVFLIGFTLAMHLANGARGLRSKKGDFLKADYLFYFCLMYIASIVLASGCFDLVSRGYSFPDFWRVAYRDAWGVLTGIIRQLFLRP